MPHAESEDPQGPDVSVMASLRLSDQADSTVLTSGLFAGPAFVVQQNEFEADADV